MVMHATGHPVAVHLLLPPLQCVPQAGLSHPLVAQANSASVLSVPTGQPTMPRTARRATVTMLWCMLVHCLL
jgi:hypothetical protein